MSPRKSSITPRKIQVSVSGALFFTNSGVYKGLFRIAIILTRTSSAIGILSVIRLRLGKTPLENITGIDARPWILGDPARFLIEVEKSYRYRIAVVELDLAALVYNEVQSFIPISPMI
jgi:hypothetical protein